VRRNDEQAGMVRSERLLYRIGTLTQPADRHSRENVDTTPVSAAGPSTHGKVADLESRRARRGARWGAQRAAHGARRVVHGARRAVRGSRLAGGGRAGRSFNGKRRRRKGRDLRYDCTLARSE